MGLKYEFEMLFYRGPCKSTTPISIDLEQFAKIRILSYNSKYLINLN